MTKPKQKQLKNKIGRVVLSISADEDIRGNRHAWIFSEDNGALEPAQMDEAIAQLTEVRDWARAQKLVKQKGRAKR